MNVYQNNQIIKNQSVRKEIPKKTSLNVMLTCRDRSIFTQKSIDSLLENTKKFDEINIYCFDNLSTVDGKRFSIFENLIKEKKIVYYSYDTDISSNNCFPKSIAYFRWMKMMQLYTEMPDNKANYYLMMDNDMIICPRWDEFFISASNNVKADTHYIVKRPGGMVVRNKNSSRVEIKNIFNNKESFILLHGVHGGGSGFWFMTENMMKKHNFTERVAKMAHNKTRGDDCAVWNSIRNKTKRESMYVCGVTPPSDSPLVLHMGPVIGSICNLSSKEYFRQKESFISNEKDFERMCINDIIDQYKNDKICTAW